MHLRLPLSKVYLYLRGVRLKGLLSLGDGSARIGLRGANVRKKAQARECRGGRNIRPLKCFSQTFLPPPRRLK